MIKKGAWAILILLLIGAAVPLPTPGIPVRTAAIPLYPVSDREDSQASVCTACCPVTGNAGQEARTGSLPRTAGTSPESFPGNAAAQQILPSTTGGYGRISGIRKIYPKNLLDHPERAAVYTLIVAKPGINLARIAAELAVNRQTLRYHLELMESFGKIVVIRDHGVSRYYENHGKYGTIEKNILLHHWNPTAKKILGLLKSHPGIMQSELAARLSITAPTIRWYMRRFQADGIIEISHEGRCTRYVFTREAIEVIHSREF
ncbi:MAG: winged helix-turn-helix transcriptional regulator [Methanoregula sp.]|nr:winged helix-turn-helix transcriptional regulator [Methanoregula sp.]